MKNLHSWFEKGLNAHTYISSMNVHQENLLNVYNHVQVQINKEELDFLHTLQTRQLKAVILTADWCGDAMVNLPIFLRLANEGFIETRYLNRDENLELMDQYLTNGTARSIPIIILLDKDGKEIGKWGPRAPYVQDLVSTLKEEVPAKESPNYEEAFKQFISTLTAQFATDEHLWNEVKKDLITFLKSVNV
ncbi:thioredoxin family protein [Cytobacillus suaedae]|nr:thioredoxin family protein [Cytobacillus suaedae]